MVMIVVSVSLSIARLNALSIHWAAVFIIIIGNPTKPVECTAVNYTLNHTLILVSAKDVLLEKGSQNFNYLDYLIIGNIPEYPKKRSLLQFPDIPSNCTNVISAKMYIWYWYSHKASWHSDTLSPHLSHVLKAHQIKKEWVETEATSSYRRSGISWSQQWLGLDGTDADATPLDSVDFPNPPPSGDDRWIEFDITSAAQNWANGQPNYGVVIWSNRENENGRSLRFYSRERNSNRPYVDVSCSININPQFSTVVVADTDYTSNTGLSTFTVQSNSPSVFNAGNTTMEITVSSSYDSDNTVTTYNVKVVPPSTVSSTKHTPTHSIYSTLSHSSDVYNNKDISSSSTVAVTIQMVLPFISPSIRLMSSTASSTIGITTNSMYTSLSHSSSAFSDQNTSKSNILSIKITIRSTDTSISPAAIGVISFGCICAGVFAFIILSSVIVCVILYVKHSVHSSRCVKNINSTMNISPSTTMNQVYGIMINGKPLSSIEQTQQKPGQ